MTTTTTTAPPTLAEGVRFGRLERRGLLLGLSPAQVTLTGLAVTVATAAVYAAGMPGLAATAPVWTPLLLVGTLSISGRPLVAWLPVLAHWHTRRALRATTHLTRPTTLPAASDLVLPGIPGRLTVTASPTSGAALILDRRAGTVTAIARVHGSGFLLDDAAGQDRKVTGWGRALAGACQAGAVVRVQVLHRTLPGGAGQARRWWAQHALAGSSWASRLVADLLTDTQATTDRVETLLALTVKAPSRTGPTLGAAGGAAVERHVSAFADALTAAELTVSGWVTPARLGGVLRAAYDPDAATRTDHGDDGAALAPDDEQFASALVGPMGVEEYWDRVRTDSAWHAVYWVSEWPRSTVHPGFLQPLLLAPGTRRTVTLLAEPLPVGRALREIRRAKVEHAADATHRARVGQVEDETTRAEAADLARREADLVAGHGDLRFTGLIVVTAPDEEALAGACAATEAAAAQAVCEVRRLVGQQGQAHAAAALPLGRGLL